MKTYQPPTIIHVMADGSVRENLEGVKVPDEILSKIAEIHSRAIKRKYEKEKQQRCC